MLERRTSQGMLRLVQPKDEGGVSSKDKIKGTEKVERDPMTVNGNRNGDHEAKTQDEKTETNHVPSHAGITKPGPVNASSPPAVEKMSPSATPGLGKLTYNPITHAPSMSECTCTDSMYVFYLHLLNKGNIENTNSPFSSFRCFCSEPSRCSSLLPLYCSQQETNGTNQ